MYTIVKRKGTQKRTQVVFSHEDENTTLDKLKEFVCDNWEYNEKHDLYYFIQGYGYFKGNKNA